MNLDFTAITARERYHLLTSFVGPRPIALVSTCGTDGRDNAAPMSFFNVFSHDPALLVLGMQPRRDGREKDSMRNIRDTGVFVVNMVDMALAHQMLICGLDPGPEVDEIALAGLTAAPGAAIAAPRIVESPCTFECRVERIIDYPRRALVVGEVVHFWAHDTCLASDGRSVDPDSYQPIARLHDDNYIASDQQVKLLPPRLDDVLAKRKAAE